MKDRDGRVVMIEIVNIADMGTLQLVSAYGLAQELLGCNPEPIPIGTRKREIILGRLAIAQNDLLKMYGHAEVGLDYDGNVTWVTEKLANTDKKRTGFRTSLNLQAHMALLVSKNPKMNGTRAHAIFEVYFSLPGIGTDNPPTVELYVDILMIEGYTRKLALSTLHWDINHNFISLGSADLDTVQRESTLSISSSILDSTELSKNNSSARNRRTLVRNRVQRNRNVQTRICDSTSNSGGVAKG
jgi:hypothetical protein